MKSKFTLLTIALAFVFASCEQKDLYDETKVEKKITDLAIPDGFNWKMVKDVTCDFSAATATQIAIYSDKDCNDGSLLASTTVLPGNEDALNLILPSYQETVHIRCGNSVTSIPVINGVLKYNVPTTRGEGDGETEGTNIYFPSKNGWGTAMFEDMFPVEGDYDFNDFVVNYRYVIELSKNNDSKTGVFTFYLRVNALGGIYDYEPCLRLKGLGYNHMSSGNKAPGITLNDQAIDGIVYNYDYTAGKGRNGWNNADVVFCLGNIVQKPSGVTYFNTQKVDIAKNQLPVYKFSIEFDNNSIKKEIFSSAMFDFFLLGDEYEIHQKGYEPVIKTAYPDGFAKGDDYYTLPGNKLVWGLSVPAEIDHAMEKANFLKAYPQFADWATSGGVNSPKWYTTSGEGLFVF